MSAGCAPQWTIGSPAGGGAFPNAEVCDGLFNKPRYAFGFLRVNKGYGIEDASMNKYCTRQYDIYIQIYIDNDEFDEPYHPPLPIHPTLVSIDYYYYYY